MANEQILTIKLNVDTTAVGKLISVNKDLTTSTNEQINLEKIRTSLEEQRIEKLKRLEDVINRANIATMEGARGANLGFANATRAADAYNRVLEKTASLNNAINLGIRPSESTKATVSTTGPASFTGISGLSQQTIPKEAIDSIKQSQQALIAHAEASKTAEVAHRGLITRIVEGVSIYKLYNATLAYTKEALLNIPKAGIAFQATESALTGIFGSEGTGKNLDFLRSIADRAGQSITGLQEAYGRFAPSAILAGASQGEINKSFQQFAEVGTILHLTTDKMNSLFLALDQMYAKGVVQSEEIKKQLGNVLPGAVEVGAKAMEKTPAQFMDMMKKNLVSAKEFIPKFAELYRTTFGGVDDTVFETVRVRLLSNLHRVANEYNYISVDIFKSTQDMMNNIVKAVANGLTTFRENLTGAGQALEIFAGLIVTRLAVASVAGIASLGSLSAVLSRFAALPVLLTGLSNPISLTIAGIVGLYGSLNNLSLGYNSAQGITIKFKDTQVALTDYIQSFSLVSIDNLRNAYNNLFSTNVDAETWKDKLATVFSGVIHPIDTAKMAIFQFIAAKRALFDSESMAAPKTFAENYSKQLTDLLASDLTATNEFNAKVLAGAKKLGEDKAKAANAPSQVIPPMPLAVIPGEDIVAKQTAEQRKALNDLYKAIGEQAKTAKAANDDLYQNNESNNRKNLISIKEYFSEKERLMLQDIHIGEEAARKELAAAIASKDTSTSSTKIEELKRFASQEKVLKDKIADEQAKASEDYAAMVEGINAEYLKSVGEMEKAAEAAFDRTHAKAREQLMVESTGPINTAEEKAKAAATLINLNTARLEVGVQAALKDYAVQRTEVNDKYNASIQRTNILLNTSSISQLESLFQIRDANKQRIADLEIIVAKEEKIIADKKTPAEDLKKSEEQVVKARQELSNFKLEGDVVANHFKNTFGSAFDTSFSNIVTGSQKASDSFKSFGVSVLKTLADMTAQMVRTAIIEKAIGFAVGAIGSVGHVSGGVNPSGIPTLLERPALAIGGVSSAPGLSALSGTVLHSPTIIPFATGGALAGEAGPEAIMPLSRDPSTGKLGVKSSGNTGQSGGNVYNIAVSVQSVKGESSDTTGNKVAEAMMKAIAQQEIANANRIGNQSNRKTSFG